MAKTKPDDELRSTVTAHVLLVKAIVVQTTISYYQHPHLILDIRLVNKIYLRGFRERTRVGDTSPNSIKLKTHIIC